LSRPLKRGEIVLMDHAGVAEAIEAAGATLSSWPSATDVSYHGISNT